MEKATPLSFIRKSNALIRIAGKLLLLVFFTLSSCDRKKQAYRSEPPSLAAVEYDLDEIVNSGVLRVITTYSPTGYFIYKGKTMGFEYELFKRLADRLSVELEMVLARNVDSVIPMLNRGEGDIIALGYTITSDRKEIVNFTEPYLITHQALIQKKPDNWRKMTLDEIDKALVKDVTQLIKDTISVRKNSSYYRRVKELSNELGDSIYIKVLPGEISDEEIIKRVALGDIKFSVIDHNKAAIHKSYFPDIDVNTPISLSQRIGWAVRKTSPELLKTINKELVRLKSKPDYNVIYKRYFQNKRNFTRRLDSEYYTAKTGKLSKYDELVKKHSKTLGWDWILVKSIIYQESMFRNKRESWSGAGGLMQLMPETALELGVSDVNDPEQNIRAGGLYLRRIYEQWENIPDSIQRIKFTIASYNCGYGHVKDAQRLSQKYGKDSLSWDNGVDYFVKNLSKSDYYNDPVVRYGYARGSETYNYVRDIFVRYRNYKTISNQSL
jgi:membrane-bound lytic murein transglycosylase F